MRLELFHGTIKKFSDNIENGIDLSKSREKLDFGKGFYLTNLEYFAKRWAINISKFHSRRGKKKTREKPVVMKFLADTEGLDIKIIYFSTPDTDWGMEIYKQRVVGKDRSDVDIMIGPIVDSNIADAVNRVESGEYTVSMFINRVRQMNKIDIQYVFKTPAAIKALTFMETKEVSDNEENNRQ